MDKQYMLPREIMIYAFRYTIGRQSSAPYIFTDCMKNNIDNVSDNDLKLYIREINECDNYGMEFDKQHWIQFSLYLQNILKERQKNYK